MVVNQTLALGPRNDPHAGSAAGRAALVERVVTAVGRHTGEAFFRELVAALASASGLDAVLLARVREDRRAEVIAGRVDGAPADGLAYDLAGTPCEGVYDGGTCVYADGVAVEFPADALLREWRVEGYLGTVLSGPQGERLGLLVGLSRQPLDDAEALASVFEISAARAGAELARLEAEQRLAAARRVLEAVAEVAMLPADADSELALMQAACRAVQARTGHCVVWAAGELGEDGRSSLLGVAGPDAALRQHVTGLPAPANAQPTARRGDGAAAGWRLRCDRADAAPGWRQAFERWGVREVAAIPVWGPAGRQVTLCVATTAREGFGEPTLLELERLARCLALGLEVVRERAQRRLANEVLEIEAEALRLFRGGEEVAQSLERLLRRIEQRLPGTLTSVLLCDERRERLRHAAAPSLPDAYLAAIDGLPIGPGVGVCGRAAALNQPIVVEDIEQDACCAPFLELARAHGLRACYSVPIRGGDGRVIGTFASYHAEPYRPDAGELGLMQRVARILGAGLERERALKELQAREELFRRTFEDASFGMFLLDTEGRFLRVNPAGSAMFMRAPETLIGRTSRELLHPDDLPRVRGAFRALVRGEVPSYRLEVRFERGVGSWMHGILNAGAVRDLSGRLIHVVAQVEDITEVRRLTEQLEHQASHDPLTGLLNRRAFEQRLAAALARVHEGGEPSALVYIDLDQFKVVNDTCGHPAGDELLRDVAALLAARLRRDDALARLGGDEFAVLLTGCALEEAEKVAAELHGAIAAHRYVVERCDREGCAPRAFNVAASIGVVAIDTTSGSPAEVMSAVDTACYAAKDAGRNRVHVARGDDATVSSHRQQMALTSTVLAALNDERFELWAQPIVPVVGEGGQRHFEVLLRLREGGRLLAPGAFLPAAERYGLSVRVDHWVVERALAWLAANPHVTDGTATCSINLSGATLGDPDGHSRILKTVCAHEALASRLCFEVTETAAISNLAHAQAFITELKGLGCRFALDDFGAGLSSFSYLKRLPVDYLKIDGSFVRDLCSDAVDRAMVRSINDIGHATGKQTIAEFVEDAATLQALADIGVDYAQGYHLGRPAPLDELS